MDFERALIEYWQGNSLTQGEATVIVACSGGPDSLALLDVLNRLEDVLSIRVIAAHYEHGIRGEASKADADFVRKYCRANEIPFFMESGKIPVVTKITGESMETAARRMRYDFLNRVAAGFDNGVIATAHHADDQAETVLMHIIRGTGTKGISGILPKRGNIIRPLLIFSKADLMAYCREQGLSPRVDETNFVADCKRNQIRLELLPLLKKKYNINITRNLCNLADIASADEKLLNELTQKAVAELCNTTELNRISCRTADILKQPLALQRRVIQYMAQYMETSLSFGHVEALRCLIADNATGSSINLPGDCQGRISYGIVYVEKNYSDFLKNDDTIKDNSLDMKLIPFSEILLNDGGIISSKLVHSLADEIPFSKNHIYCDASKSGRSVIVRYRRPGDRLLLSAGRKKLKDFLIDEKIERNRRDYLPVVVSSLNGEIIWVAGVRQTKVALVDENTKEYLILSYKPKE